MLTQLWHDLQEPVPSRGLDDDHSWIVQLDCIKEATTEISNLDGVLSCSFYRSCNRLVVKVEDRPKIWHTVKGLRRLCVLAKGGDEESLEKIKKKMADAVNDLRVKLSLLPKTGDHGDEGGDGGGDHGESDSDELVGSLNEQNDDY